MNIIVNVLGNDYDISVESIVFIVTEMESDNTNACSEWDWGMYRGRGRNAGRGNEDGKKPGQRRVLR